jgi:Uma2 family endonuclease
MSTAASLLSVDEYDRMVERGILPETNRFELIEGRIVEKDVKSPEHSAGSEGCWRAIDRALPAGWHVRIEKPVRIPNRASEPEPDVSVARGTFEDYAHRHPNPHDIALVVEVTRTSVAKDRALARVYGPGGIPAYWIVNVPKRQLEVYTTKEPGRYPPPLILREKQAVNLVIAGKTIATIPVAKLLPLKVRKERQWGEDP